MDRIINNILSIQKLYNTKFVYCGRGARPD